MGKLRITHRKRAWLTALLAFLFPGMGHVYNGQYSRGFLLLAAMLLNYTAIFRLADSDGGRHLLLIVYLGMLLPVFYFVSVYEALQFKEGPPEERVPVRLAHGILLVLSGAVMMILIKPPDMLLPWMNELAELIVGPLLMALACFFVASALSRAGGLLTFRLGRLTSSILILTVGVLLLWDEAQGVSDIEHLRDWWPLLFLLIGIEVILYSTVLRAKAAKLRLDLSGAAAALVVTVTAYAVTQYADFPVKWLDQFNVDLNGIVDYGEEKGYRVDKNVMRVLVDDRLKSITVRNVNGDVLLRAGDVDDIEVRATVWVDAGDEAESQGIAEQSTVDVTPGSDIVLEAKGQRYGPDNKRVPKMNLSIIVPRLEPRAQVETEPEDSEVQGDSESELTDADDQSLSGMESEPGSESGGAEGTSMPPETEPDAEPDFKLPERPAHALPDLEWETSPPNSEPSAIQVVIETGNGATEVRDLVAEEGLNVKSGDGTIRITRLIGPLTVQGNSGSIEADTLDGAAALEMKNGEIIASRMAGESLYAATSNGNIQLNEIGGDAEAETKNGSITIEEARGSVKANTLNGGITVESGIVGGNWDLDSSVGEIKVGIPDEGDYSLYGSVTFGKITSQLPFQQIRKTIRGSVGAGTYRIHINATNSITIESRATD